MDEQIDPELLKFLETLPPEVRDMLIQDFINSKSRMEGQGVFTPGENGSYIEPRQEMMQEPILVQAMENQRRKRSRSIGPTN